MTMPGLQKDQPGDVGVNLKIKSLVYFNLKFLNKDSQTLLIFYERKNFLKLTFYYFREISLLSLLSSKYMIAFEILSCIFSFDQQTIIVIYTYFLATRNFSCNW